MSEELKMLLRRVEQVLVDREVQYARGERVAAQGNQVAAFTAVHELKGPIRKVFAEWAEERSAGDNGMAK